MIRGLLQQRDQYRDREREREREDEPRAAGSFQICCQLRQSALTPVNREELREKWAKGTAACFNFRRANSLSDHCVRGEAFCDHTHTVKCSDPYLGAQSTHRWLNQICLPSETLASNTTHIDSLLHQFSAAAYGARCIQYIYTSFSA